jgi:hypothetical protein
VTPSFSGSTDEEGDPVEYTVDLQPFQIWKRVIHTVHATDGSEFELVRVKPVIQPYACNCPDFEMRPMHPCKHIEMIVREFFPEYYVDISPLREDEETGLRSSIPNPKVSP